MDDTPMGDSHSTHNGEAGQANDNIIIYVNGKLVPKQDAVVSVYDSGFMLGDGMWEGLRLYDGEWAFFDEHMDRLFNSLKSISLDIDMGPDDIRNILDKTVEANGMINDVHCRLMITRGRKSKPFQHPGLSIFGPTIVAVAEHSKPSEILQRQGIRLATVPQVRGLPMSQDPKYNSHSKLNCVIGCLQAEQAGADEALMLDPNGFVNTTNSCNLFIVRRGEVWTSTGDYCMNGITRQKVIDLCRANEIQVYEKNFSLYEVYGADEVFLTGTFGAQTPVSMIDGKKIGAHEGAGLLTCRIQSLYKKLVSENITKQKTARKHGMNI